MDPFNTAAAAAGPWVLVLGFIGAVLYAILRGALVPRSHVDLLREQWEARLGEYETRLAESHAREQDWRSANERNDQRADIATAQVAELLPLARTTVAILQALPVAPAGAPPTVPRGIPRPGPGDA